MLFGFDICINKNNYSGYFNAVPIPLTNGNECYYENILNQTIYIRLHEKTDLTTKITKRNLEIINKSTEEIVIHKARILVNLPIPHAHLSYFTSDWGSEYSPIEMDVTYPIRIGTWSGRSTKGCDTYFTIGWNGFGYFGTSIGYSGNWVAYFERKEDYNECSIGLPNDFFTTLKPNQSFSNIDIYQGFSEKDKEDLSYQFRHYYRSHISLLPKNMDTLPVVFNHWWPYEDKYINEDIFYENAALAKKMGMTNTMLDAGWFGPSEEIDPNKSMPWFLKRGDWDLVNRKLFPNGIAALGKRVELEGIDFGIWCEIEAVGKEAVFNQKHDELLAKRDGKSLEYVCFANTNAIKWALNICKTLVEEYHAKWIKFDFNLDPGLGCNCNNHGHGAGDGLFAHYMGYYSFLEKLHIKYPDVYIENCSSGGLRMDWGLMKRSHFAFLSDPDYTPHHGQCYWGALSHIHQSSCFHFTWSEVVCDHNGERIPIRCDTTLEKLDYMVRSTMTGTLGFSLKLINLPEWAVKRITEHISFYKKISANYLLNGNAIRLTEQPSRDTQRNVAWSGYQFIEETNKNSIVFIFKDRHGCNKKNILLHKLEETSFYHLFYHNCKKEKQATGYELMNNGVNLFSDKDCYSEIIEIIKI